MSTSVNNRNRGFTLIELMVSLVLGLVVIGGVMGVFISTYQANAQNIKAVRLNEEMRAVMSMITRDVRRAGGRDFDWNASVNWYVSTNPLATNVAWAVSDTAVATDACLRLAYAVSATETNYVGYRLVKNSDNKGVVQMHFPPSTSNWSCAATSNWEAITDPEIAWIQSLSFTVTTEPDVAGVEVRTVIVNLRAGTHTRDTDPSDLTADDCSNVDVVCRQIQEKIRVRNDAVL
jgi:prepilin-type N-terminal cleavage/methylation domain-containing protein